MTDKGTARLQSTSIICSALLFGIAPYAVFFGLRVPIHAYTPILYFFSSLVILSFLSIVGTVCAFLLAQRNTWRLFRIVLGATSFAVSAFVLIQWIKFDLMIKAKIVIPHPWKAMAEGVAVALLVGLLAAWLIRSSPRKYLAQILLFVAAASFALGGFHAFQFAPYFRERGNDLASLKHYAPEDLQDTPAPPFTLQTINGGSYSLESDRHKVIILDFWATWCGPCIAELPHFQKMTSEFRDESVTFLALSVDHDTARVKPFIDSLGYTFTTLFGTIEVYKAYTISSIPTTFIIDKNKTIRKVYVGYFAQTPESMRRVIRDLLNE